jgi:hypothetical protein
MPIEFVEFCLEECALPMKLAGANRNKRSGKNLAAGLLVLGSSVFSQLVPLRIPILLQLLSFGFRLLLFGFLPLVAFIFVGLIRHASQILELVFGE